MYWGDTRSITLLYQIALNTYLCANVLGLVQGLSVIRFFYKLKIGQLLFGFSLSLCYV